MDERSASDAQRDAQKALQEARIARLRMGFLAADLRRERTANHWAERLRLAYEGEPRR